MMINRLRGCYIPRLVLKLSVLAAGLIIFPLTSAGFAQEISLSDLENLLSGGVAQRRIADLVKERGIDFELTDELRAKFRKIGATPSLIDSLNLAAIRRRLKVEAEKAKAEASVKDERQTSESKKQQPPASETRSPATKADPPAAKEASTGTGSAKRIEDKEAPKVAREPKPSPTGKTDISQEKAVKLPDQLKETAEQVLTLEKVTIRDGEVSGELVNRSPQGVYGVELQVLYSWRWNSDYHPGRDDPGRAEYFKIEREISPGQRVPFVHRPSPPLPVRKDGTFDITIKVISFTKIFRSG
jgi:hypothetical protein